MEKTSNERAISEKILFAVSNQSGDLTISRQKISEFCEANNVRFTAVITFIGDCFTPEITGLHGEALTYRLTQKGLEFVAKGCWSGIEKIEIDCIQRESEAKQKEIDILISENKKNRKVALISGIFGGLCGLAGGIIALLSN